MHAPPAIDANAKTRKYDLIERLLRSAQWAVRLSRRNALASMFAMLADAFRAPL
jgi:hypothetical protein